MGGKKQGMSRARDYSTSSAGSSGSPAIVPNTSGGCGARLPNCFAVLTPLRSIQRKQSVFSIERGRFKRSRVEKKKEIEKKKR